ncbi:hypothetical protein F7734_08885 [Scytonema sp. UIC 10036]|uniref:hypothetical protein n=1 Tax=Scytonema sp. UIC 10036 TaxID=2304196 RepID=UPI0012DAB2C4|nr:hypothetical protein [Scytonema sp. UIC 10036]MUG92568.1 hypothetical protein [Scytonema sp. UIC 10036]
MFWFGCGIVADERRRSQSQTSYFLEKSVEAGVHLDQTFVTESGDQKSDRPLP